MEGPAAGEWWPPAVTSGDFGVHSAMPMKTQQLCPEAVVLSTVRPTASIQWVTESFGMPPLFEKTSIDEFYLDFSGMEQFFGVYRYAGELRQRILKETGLPISFGLSVNKTVSKVATGEAKPNNQMRIEQGRERSFLAPLSVQKIPMVGEKTYQTLCDLGVRKVKTLQEMPVDLMEQVMGRNGKLLWEKANGVDRSPVIPFQERKSISTERTFDRDTIDTHRLKGILTAMTENLAFQLRRGNKLTACVALKIRFSDFETRSLQRHIPYTAADHQLIPLVRDLFARCYNRRLLVRLVGIRFSELVGVDTRLISSKTVKSK